jgi:hypothetical protein
MSTVIDVVAGFHIFNSLIADTYYCSAVALSGEDE